MKQSITLFAAMALVLTLMNSCMTDIRKPLTPAMVGAKDVVVVGSVSFSPSIKFLTKGVDEAGKPAYVTSSTPEVGLVVSDDAAIHDPNYYPSIFGESRVNWGFAPAESIFVTKANLSAEVFLLGYYVFLGEEWDTHGAPAIYRGKFKAEVPAGAKAVYVGEVQILLNEQYLPVGFTIIDKYDSAKLAFAERFPGYELVRSELIDLNPKK